MGSAHRNRPAHICLPFVFFIPSASLSLSSFVRELVGTKSGMCALSSKHTHGIASVRRVKSKMWGSVTGMRCPWTNSEPISRLLDYARAMRERERERDSISCNLFHSPCKIMQGVRAEKCRSTFRKSHYFSLFVWRCNICEVAFITSWSLEWAKLNRREIGSLVLIQRW